MVDKPSAQRLADFLEEARHEDGKSHDGDLEGNLACRKTGASPS
jgi:hypothetical protein